MSGSLQAGLERVQAAGLPCLSSGGLGHSWGTTHDQPPPRLAFSVAETAQMLGVCDKTIRRLVARGLLRRSRALRHLLIPRSEIERFLKETL